MIFIRLLFLVLMAVDHVRSSVLGTSTHDILDEFRSLKKIVEKLKQENGEIRRRLDSIEKGRHQMTSNAEMTVKEEEKRLLLSPALDRQDQAVAFTAVLTKDFSLGKHQTIEYNKVTTNIGNAYDTRHGHFTAPVHGIYLMSASSMSDSNTGIHTEIVRNGEQIVAMYGDDYDIASHTIVVELEPNDMVWVRHMANDGDSTNAIVHSGADRYYCSFSGVLIKSLT